MDPHEERKAAEAAVDAEVRNFKSVEAGSKDPREAYRLVRLEFDGDFRAVGAALNKLAATSERIAAARAKGDGADVKKLEAGGRFEAETMLEKAASLRRKVAEHSAVAVLGDALGKSKKQVAADFIEAYAEVRAGRPKLSEQASDIMDGLKEQALKKRVEGQQKPAQPGDSLPFAAGGPRPAPGGAKDQGGRRV